MNRVFIGVRQDSQMGQVGRECDVYLEQNGIRHRLTRSVKGVQEGYRWDGTGPQSTELARAILWVASGVEPPWSLYKGFTTDVIATLPSPHLSSSGGECWRLSEEDVRAWLGDVRWPPASSTNVHDTAAGTHPQVRRTWADRLKSAAHLFRRRVAA